MRAGDEGHNYREGCGNQCAERQNDLPKDMGDGDGVGAQQLRLLCWSTVSRLVLLLGSGFGVVCQYLYLDFSGCRKAVKAWRTRVQMAGLNVSPLKLWKAVLAILFELVS